MSDVEKSLQQVYSSTIQSTGFINDRNRSNSVSPFPRSPSFHFPPTTVVKINKEKVSNNNMALSLILPANNEEGGLAKIPSVEIDYAHDEGN